MDKKKHSEFEKEIISWVNKSHFPGMHNLHTDQKELDKLAAQLTNLASEVEKDPCRLYDDFWKNVPAMISIGNVKRSYSAQDGMNAGFVGLSDVSSSYKDTYCKLFSDFFGEVYALYSKNSKGVSRIKTKNVRIQTLDELKKFNTELAWFTQIYTPKLEAVVKHQQNTNKKQQTNFAIGNMSKNIDIDINLGLSKEEVDLLNSCSVRLGYEETLKDLQKPGKIELPKFKQFNAIIVNSTVRYDDKEYYKPPLKTKTHLQRYDDCFGIQQIQPCHSVIIDQYSNLNKFTPSILAHNMTLAFYGLCCGSSGKFKEELQYLNDIFTGANPDTHMPLKHKCIYMLDEIKKKVVDI